MTIQNCLELGQNEQAFKFTHQSLDAGYQRKELGLNQDDFLEMTAINSLLRALPETGQDLLWREMRIACHSFHYSAPLSVPQMCHCPHTI